MTIDDCKTIAPAIGMALDLPGGGRGFIVAIEEAAGDTFTLFGGQTPMSRDRLKIRAAGEGGHLYTFSENIAAPMLYRARYVPPIGEVEAAALWERAKEEKEAAERRNLRKQAETDGRREQSRAEYERLRPAWAKSAIIAELDHDASDSMTDYYNHTTSRCIVLAWSAHTRDLFAEMRKAAANHPETAHLQAAPETAEHREKYSMGAGYYLKNGGRDSSGWSVKKKRADWINFPGLEFSDTTRGEGGPSPAKAIPTGEAGQTGSNAAGLFAIERHTHSKKGFAMFVCTMAERVERADFDRFLSAAKALGGWYSRAWAGSPAGFAFKSEAAALQFIGGVLDSPTGEVASGATAERAAPTVGISTAAKLRALADGLQGQIDACYSDRLSNTPKRARQAAEKRNEGRNLERAQAMMRALADCHESGTVPAVLQGIATKAQIVLLASEETDRGGGYYDAGIPLGRPRAWADAKERERAAALWALLASPADAERERKEDLRRKIDALQFAKIPGYYPTPAAVVARMIDAAELEPGAHVLEPSAGSGAIADALREAGHSVDCVERHCSLRAILEAKGHTLTGHDFTEYHSPAGSLYDAVLMNPPFENGQDCQHVSRAWSFVKPGGALVAIMGAGVTFRKGTPYTQTREWLESERAEIVVLPGGTFAESGTGVVSVMVTLRKTGEA